MSVDRVLYCIGPDRDGNPGACGREVAGHGMDACESHLKQLQRTGKMVPIAEKVSPKEHLINLYDRFAEADSDEEALRRSLRSGQLGSDPASTTCLAISATLVFDS